MRLRCGHSRAGSSAPAPRPASRWSWKPWCRFPSASTTSGNQKDPGKRSTRLLVIVRGFHGSLIVQEVGRAQRMGDVLEYPGRLTPLEEAAEVGGRPRICEVECALGHAKIMLYEAENTAEV